MNDKAKTTVVILIIALIGCGGVYGLAQVNWKEVISIPKVELVDENKKVLEAVEGVSAIQNQKIIGINGNEISLENGSKFKVLDPSNINCKVNDIITGYNQEKQSFVCLGENEPTERYITQPNDGILDDLLLYHFFFGNTYLNNNGYVPSTTMVGNTRTTVYKGNNGSEITTTPTSKPSVTKPSTATSTSSSGKSDGGGDAPSNAGRGGGFGKSGSGTS